jgi:hypothetical protein
MPAHTQVLALLAALALLLCLVTVVVTVHTIIHATPFDTVSRAATIERSEP